MTMHMEHSALPRISGSGPHQIYGMRFIFIWRVLTSKIRSSAHSPRMGRRQEGQTTAKRYIMVVLLHHHFTLNEGRSKNLPLTTIRQNQWQTRRGLLRRLTSRRLSHSADSAKRWAGRQDSLSDQVMPCRGGEQMLAMGAFK